MHLPFELVRLATLEVGTEEVNGTNCGPRVNQYKAATTLDPNESWPWCAAFICFIVREAMKSLGIKETQTFHRPTTASAFNLINWSLGQDKSTQTLRNKFDGGLPFRDILPGDLIIYTFSHCGIATCAPDDTGHFLAIEGNTDDGGGRDGGAVLKRTRRTTQVKARIRFTI